MKRHLIATRHPQAESNQCLKQHRIRPRRLTIPKIKQACRWIKTSGKRASSIQIPRQNDKRWRSPCSVQAKEVWDHLMLHLKMLFLQILVRVLEGLMRRLEARKEDHAIYAGRHLSHPAATQTYYWRVVKWLKVTRFILLSWKMPSKTKKFSLQRPKMVSLLRVGEKMVNFSNLSLQ